MKICMREKTKVCFMTKTISNDAMQKKGTSQMGKKLLIYVVRWVKGFISATVLKNFLVLLQRQEMRLIKHELTTSTGCV